MARFKKKLFTVCGVSVCARVRGVCTHPSKHMTKCFFNSTREFFIMLEVDIWQMRASVI